MNGNNTQTKDGFISALGHPRKKQLATILLSENPTIESIAKAGFDRITTLEMIRSIRNSVEGMKDFSFEWPRNSDVKITKPVAPAPVASVDNANQGNVPSNENKTDGNTGNENALTAKDGEPVPPGANTPVPPKEPSSLVAPAPTQG